jgi:hypothetical protein
VTYPEIILFQDGHPFKQNTLSGAKYVVKLYIWGIFIHKITKQTLFAVLITIKLNNLLIVTDYTLYYCTVVLRSWGQE